MRTLILLLLLSTPAWGQFVSLGGNGQPGGSALGLPEQWLMHDGSGSTFADATPNNNTITASNITWGTGTGVTSPLFNGSTSTAVAAQTAITNFDGTKPFSVSVWFNNAGTGASQPALVSTLVPSSNYQGWGLELAATTGSPDFFLINNYNTGNAIDVSGSFDTSPGPGFIYNVIATYDGSQTAAGVKFYENGTLQSNQAPVKDGLTGSTASGVPLHVGSRSDGTQPFGGSMSNLQIFSGVLTSGQIAAIQTAGP